MKTKIITIVMAFMMFSTIGKSQNRSASALKDPGQREAILDSIASNSELLQKVNDKAKGSMNGMNGMQNMNGMNMGSDTSMMGMMSNPDMMSGMMDMMMKQCSNDTAMCRTMCTKMMKNPKMMEMMMKGMMNNKGMMDSTKMKMNH